MKNLNRIYSKKISEEEKSKLMNEVFNFISSNTHFSKVIFFGSIVTAKFDEYSDIDVLCIYKTPYEADQARRILYNSKRPDSITYPLEIICVDETTYTEKSKKGGVYFVAAETGTEFLHEELHNKPSRIPRS